MSNETLQASHGSLYPALHKLEHEGWIRGEWKESHTGRQAKFYSLTRASPGRSEEHTSELQSPCNLVCRLLLEKKKTNNNAYLLVVDHLLERIVILFDYRLSGMEIVSVLYVILLSFTYGQYNYDTLC